jgi:hypothetical protein
VREWAIWVREGISNHKKGMKFQDLRFVVIKTVFGSSPYFYWEAGIPLYCVKSSGVKT